MPRVKIHKTNFTSGEIASELLGRGDLTAYDNGASTLRNVIVRPTGSLTRRPGLRFVATARGPGRIVSFEFNTEQVYVFVFSNNFLDVFQYDQWITGIPTPWSSRDLKQISWTQSADTLLVVHPAIPPKKLTRDSLENFQISEWSFVNNGNRILQPHSRFAASNVKLSSSGTTGSVTLTASSGYYPFHPDHIQQRFRLRDKEVKITGMSGTPSGDWYPRAKADVVESLVSTTFSADWTEPAWSRVRGYPTTVTFHQDRLVVGGSLSLPNHLWFSKSGDLFNFDLGSGLDDEAIEFSILSDQVNAISGMFSGRHLQIFTSGAEWMVTGDPLTPTEIQLKRQTRVGSATDRTIAPRSVDGATMFAARNGRQLREFLFTDVEQAYQATDLGLLSHHLINSPIDMDYDQMARLLHVVMADGTLATLTIYRAEQVTAWTLQQTAGRFLSVAVVGDEVFVLIERDGLYYIEAFDSSLSVDSGLVAASGTPKHAWSGFQHLEGQLVKVIADGTVQPDAIVQSGQLFLAEAALEIQAGLAYNHVIEPLPPQIVGQGNSNQGLKTRPVALTFRLHETEALSVDVGRGVIDVPFRRFHGDAMESKPAPFSGDKTLRALGWQHEHARPVWRIDQDTPLPFHLLSVTTEISVNGL